METETEFDEAGIIAEPEAETLQQPTSAAAILSTLEQTKWQLMELEAAYPDIFREYIGLQEQAERLKTELANMVRQTGKTVVGRLWMADYRESTTHELNPAKLREIAPAIAAEVIKETADYRTAAMLAKLRDIDISPAVTTTKKAAVYVQPIPKSAGRK